MSFYKRLILKKLMRVCQNFVLFNRADIIIGMRARKPIWFSRCKIFCQEEITHNYKRLFPMN